MLPLEAGEKKWKFGLLVEIIFCFIFKLVFRTKVSRVAAFWCNLRNFVFPDCMLNNHQYWFFKWPVEC